MIYKYMHNIHIYYIYQLYELFDSTDICRNLLYIKYPIIILLRNIGKSENIFKTLIESETTLTKQSHF